MWKAPKAGTVKVTLGRDNEPQRRNANASGTVTLALTKNGETLCTADISTAQTKNDDFVNCLKSDKGTVQVNAGQSVLLSKEIGIQFYNMDQKVYISVNPDKVNLFHKGTGRLVRRAVLDQ